MDTKSLDEMESLAHEYVDRRRNEQAKGVISQGLASYPDSTELRYLSAHIDYVEDREDEALHKVEDVLSSSPSHFGARMLRARLLENVDRLEDAEATWLELLAEFPESADCYAGYAGLMIRALKLDKAERLLTEGLRLEPENPDCLYFGSLIDVIRNRKHGSEARLHLHDLITRHPERIQSSIALVIALSDRGDNAEALRVARELLASFPGSRRILELVKSLELQTHWSLLPLYPMQRWGWGGAIAVTIAIWIVLQAMSAGGVSPPVRTAVALGLLIYIAYSWIWPPILKRILR